MQPTRSRRRQVRPTLTVALYALSCPAQKEKVCLNKTIVLISHNRPIQERTMQCIQALRRQGAAYLEQSGSADVTLARNIALSGALRAVDDGSVGERDVILMVDDDMIFSLAQATCLVTHARESERPASACYATLGGTLAATRLDKTVPRTESRWVCGLGLIAIPVQLLQQLRDASPSFTYQNLDTHALTESRWCEGQWWSEDYWLCRRLGGADLLPIAVGHLKTIPIFPDDHTIDCIANHLPLDGEPDAAQLEKVVANG